MKNQNLKGIYFGNKKNKNKNQPRFQQLWFYLIFKSSLNKKKVFSAKIV